MGPKCVGRAVSSKTSQAGMTMAYEVGPRGQRLFGGATSADAPPPGTSSFVLK